MPTNMTCLQSHLRQVKRSYIYFPKCAIRQNFEAVNSHHHLPSTAMTQWRVMISCQSF
jgi:hypothetical protein